MTVELIQLQADRTAAPVHRGAGPIRRPSAIRRRSLLAAFGLALAAAVLPAAVANASPQSPGVETQLTNPGGNPQPPQPPDPPQWGPQDLADPTVNPEPPLPPDLPDGGPDEEAVPTDDPEPPLPPDPGGDDEVVPTDDPDPVPPSGGGSIPTPQRVDTGLGGAAAGSHQAAGLALIATALVLAGSLLVAGCQRPSAEVGEPNPAVVPTPAVAAAAGQPISIAIPAAGVDAEVVPVGLGPERAMEVPDPGLAGWYELGPRPGEAGPAVIVGHVDSRSGPAVFFRLGQLRGGDRIVVGQQGGAARSFEVERVERQPKEALPVRRIWNRTSQPVLRLITCGGSFDRSTGHYRDNLVVYARAG